MKRTTYILIGLFVAGLCVLVGGMFVMYCLGRPHFSNQINLQGEQLTKEMPGNMACSNGDAYRRM